MRKITLLRVLTYARTRTDFTIQEARRDLKINHSSLIKAVETLRIQGILKPEINYLYAKYSIKGGDNNV